LIIGDTAGTTAADFGIAGTFDTTATTDRGANLQRQWVTENTLLATYNGGKGVTPGKFKITTSSGASATIDLTQGNEIRISDVMQEINSKDFGVTASINAHGDGLLLTDTTGGSGAMKVEDLSGTAAADLNIKGTSSTGSIDGSFEKTIGVTAADTLQTLQTKINNLGWGVNASIINDGSGVAPYRLALNATNSGLSGRVVIDDGATTLGTRTLVQAQNAAVFVGGAGSAQPLLITASKNQLSGVIKGVSIELNGVSDGPVTLNVTGNIDSVVTEINTFTQNFNDMIDKIGEYTKWDTTTNTGGVLLGDETAQTIETRVYNMLQTVNTGAGRYRILADVGITLGDGAKVVFDEDKFRQAYATDPTSVKKLFTEVDNVTGASGASTVATPGLGYALENQISNLIDPVSGVITRENNTLDERTQGFQDRITQLNALIDQKRTRLQEQFANLESVLAGLQSQQQALGQITTIRAPTTTSSK
jgi:flagellar hook-associated protein 2